MSNAGTFSLGRLVPYFMNQACFQQLSMLVKNWVGYCADMVVELSQRTQQL